MLQSFRLLDTTTETLDRDELSELLDSWCELYLDRRFPSVRFDEEADDVEESVYDQAHRHERELAEAAKFLGKSRQVAECETHIIAAQLERHLQ